jgi:hypothetical protein
VGTALGLAAARPLPTLRVVAGCVAAMIGYGALQDQFSARLCPEYFTVAHRPIAGLTDPTLLGLAWGFLGGWWGGLLLGLGMAAAARAGSAPPTPTREIVRPLAALFVGIGTVSALTCVGSLYNADLLGVSVGEPWATAVPAERHRALVAVARHLHHGNPGRCRRLYVGRAAAAEHGFGMNPRPGADRPNIPGCTD